MQEKQNTHLQIIGCFLCDRSFIFIFQDSYCIFLNKVFRKRHTVSHIVLQKFVISTMTNELCSYLTRVNVDQKLLHLNGLCGLLCLIVVLHHCLLMAKGVHQENYSIVIE